MKNASAILPARAGLHQETLRLTETSSVPAIIVIQTSMNMATAIAPCTFEKTFLKNTAKSVRFQNGDQLRSKTEPLRARPARLRMDLLTLQDPPRSLGSCGIVSNVAMFASAKTPHMCVQCAKQRERCFQRLEENRMHKPREAD